MQHATELFCSIIQLTVKTEQTKFTVMVKPVYAEALAAAVKCEDSRTELNSTTRLRSV